MVLVFNVFGLAMFLAGFGAAAGVLNAFGSSNDALGMLIGGPLLVVLDFYVRRWRRASLFGRGGGALFWLPVWLWGIGWTVLGTFQLIHGH